MTSPIDSARFERDQQPAPVPIWLESLAGLDWLSLRLSPVYCGRGVPRGDGSPVVVVPGFLASDFYLYELYWWLRRIGYRPYLSRIGRNAECLDLLVTRLFVTIDRAHRDTGRKVHLIGHSLGGLLARAAAVRRPSVIASVTALGTPLRGIRSHPLILRISDRVRRRILRQMAAGDGGADRPECFTGYCGCETVSALQLPVPEGIPSLAIYTRSDGIVDWQCCMDDDPAANVEVKGTHIGLAFNPQVFRVIGGHLATVTSAPTTPAAPATPPSPPRP